MSTTRPSKCSTRPFTCRWNSWIWSTVASSSTPIIRLNPLTSATMMAESLRRRRAGPGELGGGSGPATTAHDYDKASPRATEGDLVATA